MKLSAKSFLKKPVYGRMLIAILVGMVLTATSTMVSVKARPGITVTVSPSSGLVGSTMTVSGVNASSNSEVRIFMVGFIFLATTMANGTGGYSINITVPAIPADIYGIMVLDVETGDTASDTFTVQRKIVLDSEVGSYMDNTTVKGYGFRDSTLITLTFDGIDVTPTPQPETDMLGSFEAKFSVPSTPNGTYTVTADDGTNNASALFTVIPKITLSPKTSGPPGTLVIVTGTGFSPSAEVTIEFDTINVTSYWGVTTWTDGSFGIMFTPSFFFVPEVSDGTYTIKATDENAISANAPFVVPSPVMTLEPSTTFGSSMVTAKGLGFPPNQPVLLYLEDSLMVNLIDLMSGGQKLFADEYGSYEDSFIVPVTKPGVYAVTAYNILLGEELASTSLTIIENPTLENIDARLVSINGSIATIETSLGAIEVDISDINARVVSIDGKVATIETDLGTIEIDISDIDARLVSINGSIATIETSLGAIEVDISDINARVVSIDGKVATIETDLGTIEADVSDIQAETVPAGYELAVASTILALIASIGAWLSAILIRRKPVQLFATEKQETKPKSRSKSK